MSIDPRQDETAPAPPGSALEVLRVFLWLGLTSFGGPVAHLGYFRAEFVQRRRWLDDGRYADLVALCQFLPGPASSQVGIALGLGRAGWAGAFCAWAGFTLPSAVALILFASGVAHWPALARSGAMHGLQIAAVAVVAQAVWGMAGTLCPDRPRKLIALAATLWALFAASTGGQIALIVGGGVAGWLFVRPGASTVIDLPVRGISRRTGAALLITAGLLLVLLPALAAVSASRELGVVAAFYRAGALVFGGGHVVLPLLQSAVVPGGFVSEDVFLAGYGAAQVVPGPLFTFGAFLGAAMQAPFGGWRGGLTLLAALFLPAFLTVAGALPFWDALRRREAARRAMAGINAAVLGLLAAALVDPVWIGTIRSPIDGALALAGFALLVRARWSPLPVVAALAIAGALLGR